MVDIQNLKDTRDIPLQKAGIKGLRYPVTVLDKEHKKQETTAVVDLFVNLPHQFKGTHMSRFIEVFHKHYRQLSMPHFLDMLEEICTSLDAARAIGKMTFPYFIEKNAPVSQLPSIMSYDCTYEGAVSISTATDGEQEIHRDFKVSVSVPIQTVCPCSKAISDRGAHNQRGIVRVCVQLGPFFWIEDMIRIIENAASSAVYSVLKREDEKFVTETAYDNPKFVEDMVRDVYISVKELAPFPWFSVEVENFESIHNHSAFAAAEYTAPQQP